MKKLILLLVLLFSLCIPVQASDFTAPEAPEFAEDLLPEENNTFGEGLWYVLKTAIGRLRPDLAESCGICLSVIGAVLLISLLQSYEGKSRDMVVLAGVVAISCLLLKPTKSLIALGCDTVTEMSDYGKLLLPVMTAALAAQGGTVSSASLYTATALFDAVLSTAVSVLLVPMVYIFLVLGVVNAAVGDAMMKKMRDFVKWLMTWGLKIVLYGFSAYLGITGVISGTADQAAVKATKLTISGMVPVVGSILSDASETILVSAGVVKNAAGIYGMLAILAIAVGPFLKIGVQYLLLKLTAAICGVFAGKEITGLIDDFSGAMGFLLAMTGTLCLLLLISVVCFLKGMG